jgi:hypothetical protein
MNGQVADRARFSAKSHKSLMPLIADPGKAGPRTARRRAMMNPVQAVGGGWRVARWSVGAGLLLLPLAMMQVVDG